MINKTRYQNPNFKNKLRDARSYKREYKRIPEGRMGFFLSYLHLDSAFGKVISFLVLLAAAYVLFAPNFLTIKKVEIPNVSEVARMDIENSIKTFLASKPFWPQSNIILLSKGNLEKYLVAQNRNISKVIKIEKNFPSTLTIQTEERYNRFLLKNQTGIYVVSNDGQITRQLNTDQLAASTSPDSGLITVNLSSNKQYYEQQSPADETYFMNLDEILQRMEKEFQNPVVEINLEDFERADFEVKTKAGYAIKFDSTSDLAKIFTQFKLLLKDIGDSRINGVKYIDMRIKDRGYVCYRDAACAKDFIPAQATTTPIN